MIDIYGTNKRSLIFAVLYKVVKKSTWVKVEVVCQNTNQVKVEVVQKKATWVKVESKKIYLSRVTK